MKGEAKNRQRRPVRQAALIIASCMAFGHASASELVYHPFNPSFGGNPINGQVLLNSALATNKHKGPDLNADRYGLEEKSALERFNETLERNIISRLASSASSRIMDANGNFIPGLLETENFIIEVTDPVPGSGFLTIVTTDKVTGAVTRFEVSQG